MFSVLMKTITCVRIFVEVEKIARQNTDKAQEKQCKEHAKNGMR